MSNTRIIVRAVIQKDHQVLLCRFIDKDSSYQFFPGGEVEFTEGAEVALARELQEELGVSILKSTFIGVVEALFDNDGTPFHEINLVFSASIDNYMAQSQEADHIAFTWVPIEKLESENVLPKPLAVAVMRWMKDGQKFWVGLNRPG